MPIPIWPTIPTPRSTMRSSARRLQTTKRPDQVLDELLRVGRKAFVTFPNFAHWQVRASLLWNGRMPVTRLLPVAWYETPNIHHVTVRDFRELVAAQGLSKVEGAWFLSGDKRISPAAASLAGGTRGVPAVTLRRRSPAAPIVARQCPQAEPCRFGAFDRQ